MKKMVRGQGFILFAAGSVILLSTAGCDLFGTDPPDGELENDVGDFREISGSGTISSDSVSRTVPHPEGGDFLFTGGDTISYVGAVIDVNANDIADDGDWCATAEDIVINGNQTVTFTC